MIGELLYCWKAGVTVTCGWTVLFKLLRPAGALDVDAPLINSEPYTNIFTVVRPGPGPYCMPLLHGAKRSGPFCTKLV